MSTIKGANTLSSGYDVANSCMFNPGDNPELNLHELATEYASSAAEFAPPIRKAMLRS